PLLTSVNMVNAPLVAKERNIDITEITHDREGDYHTLSRLSVETERATRVIAGTLFANKWPRIVSVLGVAIEAELTPHMLFVTNDDKPGFIGALGTLLGEAGVNIATFSLGRNEERTRAIALVSVDEAIPAAVLEKVAALKHVRRVKALTF
ncbi:MAG TPA: ACT domain-containing protein, partial [Sphingomonadales bacterium]|nr:ACT domain-containing protein [Sphingomonadales bacterium]